MSKHNNRSSRRSQSLRSSNISDKKRNTESIAEVDSIDRDTSAVGMSEQNDMSWAEEYADDNRSDNDVSSESTRVVVPRKKTTRQTDGEGSQGEERDGLSSINVEDTLTFRKASAVPEVDNEENEQPDTEETDIRETAEDNITEEQPVAEEAEASVQSEDEEDDWDGQFKIRDAVTDKTIVSFDEARSVREAASQLQMDDGWVAEPKIRDAVTDKTIVSFGEAQTVRKAASQLQMDDDWVADSKIRDAVTDKTIVSLGEAQIVRKAASQLQMDDDWVADSKIRDAVTDKTIVSLGEVQTVRKAASQLQMDDDWMADSKIRDAVTDKTIVSLDEAQTVRNAAANVLLEDDWDSHVRIRDSAQAGSHNRQKAQAVNLEEPAAAEDASLTRVFKVSKSVKNEKADKQTELKKTNKPKESGKSSSKASEYVPEEKTSEDKRKQHQQELIGNTRRTQVKDSIYGDQRKLYSDQDKINEKYIRSSRAESVKRQNKYNDLEQINYEQRYNNSADSYSDQNRYDRNRRQSRPARYDYDDRPVRRQPRSYDDYDYRRREREDDGYYYKEAKSPLRFIPLVFVIAICVLGFMAARQIAYDVPVNSADYSKYNYTITADSTDETVASDLLELGLIDNALIYRIRCILYSADYKEGTYVLSPCYSTEKIINILSGYEYGSD